MSTIFSGIFDSSTASVISPGAFLLCVACSLVAGLILAAAYTYKTRYTQSFVVTLAILPAVVCVVIMMVNGNIGAGVAVAGAFSLIRFRSVPGTAKEIGSIFVAMGVGLVAGMGYLAYALLCAIVFSGIGMLYGAVGLGAAQKASLYKTLHITIPEDLDYTGIFDDLLKKYTSEYELERVKTTNMGSLIKLTIQEKMRDSGQGEEINDELRWSSGYLVILISRQTNVTEGL